MIEPPVILVTEPQSYAAIHTIIPVAQIQSAMGILVSEVAAALTAQGVPPTGPWFTHHFHKPVETFDFEVCFPVATPIQPSGRVQPKIWPALKLARTVYHGNYTGLPAAWGEFEQWVKAHSQHPGTEFWERYLVNPETSENPEDWRTELNWPLLD